MPRAYSESYFSVSDSPVCYDETSKEFVNVNLTKMER